MTRIIALSKIGRNVYSLNPNDFVFNSLYNGFKILLETTMPITLVASTNNQTFTMAHALNMNPLVDAFAKRSGASQVFKPNGIDVELWGSKLGMTGDIKFNYVQADGTNLIVNFNNAKATPVDVAVRCFCLESIS